MKAKELSAARECAAATEHACSPKAEVLSGSPNKTSDGVLPSEVCNLIEDAGGAATGEVIVVSDESPEPEAPAPTDRPTAVVPATEASGALDASDTVPGAASSVADCAADKDVQIAANLSETTEQPAPHRGATADLPEVHLPEVHLPKVRLVIPPPASAVPAEAADLPKGKRSRRSRSKAEEDVAVVSDPKAPGMGIDGQAVEVPTGGLQQQEGGSRRPRRSSSKGGKATPQPASGSTTPIPAGTAALLGETQAAKGDSAETGLAVKASVVDLTSPAPALASIPAPGPASAAAPGEHVDLSGVSPLAGPPVAVDLPARLPQGKGAMFFMPAAERKRLLEEV